MRQLSFFNEIHDFQRFVRDNIKLLGNYTIISEQLTLSNNETGILDILVVDNDAKRLAVLELKNEMTTDKNIWQPLRYYDLLKRGEDGLRELLMDASYKFNYPISQIDLNPKLVLVVPKHNEQLLRALSYFSDIDSFVIVLNRFENRGMMITNKETYYPSSVYHKNDLVEVQNKVSESWDFDKYKSFGINFEKINLAKKMTNQIKSLFESKGYKFDMFFTNTKITITKNGKVWGHLFVKSRPLDYKLTLSFKIPKDVVTNSIDFSYNTSIESFDIQKSGLKLTLNNCISTQLIEKYLGE